MDPQVSVAGPISHRRRPAGRHARASLIATVVAALSALLAAEPVPPPSARPAAPAHYVVGLSPFLERGVKDDLFRRLVGFVLDSQPVGSTLGIFDAYRLKSVARIEIPDLRAFHSSRTRANQFREPIRLLREFLAAEPPNEGSVPGPDAIPAGSLRTPQFLDFVASHVRTTHRATVILLIGNPLYVDPREPAFSMVHGYFPSDGHVNATREQSIYGTRGRERTLAETSLFWIYFGDPWISEVHRERVSRFWNLHATALGARFATLCADPATVFDQLRPSETPPVPGPAPAIADPGATRVEMLRILRRSADPDWITRDDVLDAARQPPGRMRGPMKIGIRWKGRLDLDLYARPTSEAPWLYFEHPRSAEGFYFKDHRSSPDREFEFIEFEQPVDVRAIEARVNFYAGQVSSGPEGEVRVEFENKIYTGRFQLAAHEGNEGREGRRHTSAWVRLDIPTLLHLPPVGTAAAPGAPLTP